MRFPLQAHIHPFFPPSSLPSNFTHPTYPNPSMALGPSGTSPSHLKKTVILYQTRLHQFSLREREQVATSLLLLPLTHCSVHVMFLSLFSQVKGQAVPHSLETLPTGHCCSGGFAGQFSGTTH